MTTVCLGKATWTRYNKLMALHTYQNLIYSIQRRYSEGSNEQINDVLFNLCKRRHFITADKLSKTSLLKGCHSLGPLGKELKKNLVSQWWNSVVLYREQVLAIGTMHHIPPPHCSFSEKPLVTVWSKSHLTLDQKSSLLENSIQQHGVLRQDLLYGALLQYVQCLDLMNKRLPFGLAEIGKCFHPIPDENNSINRSRIGERTMASLTWFSSARTAAQWRDYWLRHRLLWWQKFAQSPSSFSTSDHQDNHGRKMSQIHYFFPWGKEPIESLCSMDDSALLQMYPGGSAQIQGRDGRKLVSPYILWVSGDLDRGLLAYLSDALQLTTNSSIRNKDESREVLKLHPSLAPIKVAVDMGKGPAADLRLVCQGLSSELRKNGIRVWPGYLETTHVPMERLFTKYDEMGVLFTVLVSESTLENGLLQLRSRDTTLKESLHVSKVRHFLEQYIQAANNL
ncbi:DNA polymerase subunit gamma-2 [Pelodytes ibericus]